MGEFNWLAGKNQFGLTLLRSRAAPSATHGGANVQVEVTSGDCKFFNLKGEEERGQLPFVSGQVHGRTFTVGVPPLGQLGWAFIFVPINPVARIGDRTVGFGVRVGLILHELLHAAGLEENDPGHHRPPGDQPPADADFFMTESVVILGSRPELDTQFYGSKMMPDASGQFSVTAQTTRLVQDIWLWGDRTD